MVFLSQKLFSPEISTISEGDIPALAHRASIGTNTVYNYINIAKITVLF